MSQSTNIRAADLKGPLTISLDELAVPEWWISQFNLPREFNKPSFENVTALTVDLPFTLANTVHDIELHRLELRGEQISREALYLGILVAWMLCAAVAVVWQLTALRRQQRRQERDIEALVARTAQLRQQQEDLRRQAAIDQLTGVLNRRGVEQALASLGERVQTGIALIMVDLDHFKHINDTHGHAAGDQVIAEIARRIGAAVRNIDVPGRYGGEEFVLLLPETALAGSGLLGERLRRAIAATPVATVAGPLPITASLGVATAEPDVPDAATLISRADSALYAAKQAGRNRIAAYGHPV